jgi:hypothetical protein
MTYSRNILTNRRISDNAVAVKVITHVMSTLVQLSEALRLCRNMSVSPGVGTLNGYDFLYSISVENVVLMFLILAPESANMQFKQFHNPDGQRYGSGLLVWRRYDMPLQTITSFLGRSFHNY